MTLVAAASAPAAIDVSVLVPAKDESENLPLFMEQAAAAFANSTVSYEVVVIDDGSGDDTAAVLEGLQERYPFLRVVHHRRQRGIADALRTGFLNARGRVLVFYPADLQYRPAYLPRPVAPNPPADATLRSAGWGRGGPAVPGRRASWRVRSTPGSGWRECRPCRALSGSCSAESRPAWRRRETRK